MSARVQYETAGLKYEEALAKVSVAMQYGGAVRVSPGMEAHSWGGPITTAVLTWVLEVSDVPVKAVAEIDRAQTFAVERAS